jgi:hypothetical protein
MTTVTTAANEQIQIRIPILVSPATGQLKSWTSIMLNGVPRAIKRTKSTVTFLLAGRTFIADTSSWNARASGHIEAVEKR